MLNDLAKWFYKQSKLIQLLLLLIPFVNWVIEVALRWSAYGKHGGLITLVCALLATFTFGVFGWIDLVWLILFDHLLFAKK